MSDERDPMQAGIKLHYHNMMAEYIGDQGIRGDEIKALLPRAVGAVKTVQANRGRADDLWPTEWMDLPHAMIDSGDADRILELAAEVRERFNSFIVLGIGGSALGPVAVQRALHNLRYNELPNGLRPGPRFYVEDNIDPERMAAILEIVDIENTAFNFISKAGNTAETMAQYLVLIDMIKARIGEGYANNVFVTTSAAEIPGAVNSLLRLAKREGFRRLVIPDGVGGRFSELSPVGLFPAAVCGIDIKQMLRGAHDMDLRCRNQDVLNNPAAICAMLMYLSLIPDPTGVRAPKNMSVMMPYADSLRYIADWYAQLWAESLGKKVDLQGNPNPYGQTPIKALGVTDQHSQVQLYVEGPPDKVFAFLGVRRYRSEVIIPNSYPDMPEVSYLGGHSLGALMRYEMLATEYALIKAGRPSMRIMIEAVTPYAIGQLLYFFEMQTAYMGYLMNINAYDQPGVEEGKIATYALMGRPGYEQKRLELASRQVDDERYTL